MDHSDAIRTYPRPYPEWRTGIDRAEDAAYTFGYHLMTHVRNETLRRFKVIDLPRSQDQLRVIVEKAVDVALGNVTELLEGFWPLHSGDAHNVSYALAVVVKDQDGNELEQIDISPCMLDLPIGFWKWRDGEFR